MNKNFKTHEMPDLAIEKLREIARFQSFRKGEMLVAQFDENNHVYIILDGKVKITNFSDQGREVWHFELGPGRIVGDFAAILGKSREANVVAVESTSVAVLSSSEFLKLIRYDSDISFWLINDLVSRLKTMSENFYGLVAHNVVSRIHNEILKLCDESEEFDDGYIICPMPVWADIARKINTDRESVSREISSLIKKGIVPVRTRLMGYALFYYTIFNQIWRVSFFSLLRFTKTRQKQAVIIKRTSSQLSLQVLE